ncbi:FAD-dependent oxidoreductase [Serinibacter arcticus]|uniref:FAD-dependent oxidoreductase n=1 Tax=Serinibacter arcticus TaxID=1655435 RepID=UPI0022A7CDFF|nr:FAD-dependent oxidoreductase [Serinibacter arcticus]
MERVEIAVVGGGVMGAATAWQLARRGADVLLLERFEPGHHEGASHGATRNYNTAYSSEHYLDLVLRARTLWDELASEAGTRVLDDVGLLNHGGGEARWGGVRTALHARGLAADWLSAPEAQERWPALRFRPCGTAGRDVLLVPSGARVRAAVAWRALHDGVARHGGRVRTGARAVALVPQRRGGVRIELQGGDDVVAGTVVVTVGAWTAGLVGELVPLPDLVVTQEQPAHFAPVLAAAEGIPGFNHAADPDRPEDAFFRSDFYGMATPGEGVKAGWHGTGAVVDPDARTYAAEPVQLADLRRYAELWLPGVDPEAATPISCTYTSTATTDFVLDRHGDLVVGAGFSGHGYKFAPAIGEVLARLALGGGAPEARAAAPFRIGDGRRAGAGRAGGFGT